MISDTKVSSIKNTLDSDIRVSSIKDKLKSILLDVVLPLLVVRVLLTLLGIIAAYLLTPLINPRQSIVSDWSASHLPDMLVYMWSRFDSGFYLSIAQGGYWSANTLHSQSNWGFFPFYPLVIHVLAWPFGSSSFTYQLVGLIVSNVAALAAASYLYALTAREFNRAIAAKAVYYLLLFPMGFYLFAIYPESLFLALVIASVYYARLRRWWLAGILGGLASLTRVSGVILVVALGWEYWQYCAERFAPAGEATTMRARMWLWLRSRCIGGWNSLAHRSTWVGIIALALIPCGLVLFLLYSKLQTGTFFAYIVTQQYGWRHHFSNPLFVILYNLSHVYRTSPYDWNFYWLNLGAVVLFFGLLIPVFRKLPALYGILMLAFIVLPLTTGTGLASVTRYYLTAFPAFMLLAWWSGQGSLEQQMRRHNLLLISFSLLLSVTMVMFTLSVHSVG